VISVVYACECTNPDCGLGNSLHSASDVEKLSVEVTKAIWNGSEDNPKTEAAFRSVCISLRLGSQVKEYLAGRTDGYLFQTSSGNPWGTSNALERKLNTVVLRKNSMDGIDPSFECSVRQFLQISGGQHRKKDSIRIAERP